MQRQIVKWGWLGIALLFAHTAWAEETGNGILWKIEKNSVSTSYLLGTLHSEDERVLQVADNIKEHFSACKSFTAELDLSQVTSLETASAMMISNGKELPQLIGQSRYAKSLKYLEQYGIPDLAARQLKPWAVMATISMPKPKTGVFLDRLLYDRALQQSKAVYGLESQREQVDIFDKLTLSQQITLLDEALENFPKLSQQLETLTNLYIKRDLNGLKSYTDELSKSSHQELMASLNKTLVADRNLRMAERMQVRLQEGKAFIAVGALHLPGEKGILTYLRQKGYTLTPIY